MRKLATILKVRKTNIANETTGELSDYTVISYVTAGEETDDSFGCDLRDAWVKGHEVYEKLKKVVHKPNQELVYSTTATKNGDKYRLERFADVDIQASK